MDRASATYLKRISMGVYHNKEPEVVLGKLLLALVGPGPLLLPFNGARGGPRQQRRVELAQQPRRVLGAVHEHGLERVTEGVGGGAVLDRLGRVLGLLGLQLLDGGDQLGLDVVLGREIAGLGHGGVGRGRARRAGEEGHVDVLNQST